MSKEALVVCHRSAVRLRTRKTEKKGRGRQLKPGERTITKERKGSRGGLPLLEQIFPRVSSRRGEVLVRQTLDSPARGPVTESLS